MYTNIGQGVFFQEYFLVKYNLAAAVVCYIFYWDCNFFVTEHE